MAGANTHAKKVPKIAFAPVGRDSNSPRIRLAALYVNFVHVSWKMALLYFQTCRIHVLTHFKSYQTV